MDKVPFNNGLEVTSRVFNGQQFLQLGTQANAPRTVPAEHSEFIEMIKQGRDLAVSRLEQENAALKDCLVILQQEIRDIMNEHFVPLFNAAQMMPKLLQDLQITSEKYNL